MGVLNIKPMDPLFGGHPVDWHKVSLDYINVMYLN